jgi:hypothetical protein
MTRSSAIIWGLAVGALTFLTLVFLAVRIAPPAPDVQWVTLTPPIKSYVSYLPCVRTFGWLLPTTECFPTESRNELMTLHGTDPGPDCRLGEPGGVACRIGKR